jgi:hypothetical protein
MTNYPTIPESAVDGLPVGKIAKIGDVGASRENISGIAVDSLKGCILTGRVGWFCQPFFSLQFL